MAECFEVLRASTNILNYHISILFFFQCNYTHLFIHASQQKHSYIRWRDISFLLYILPPLVVVLVVYWSLCFFLIVVKSGNDLRFFAPHAFNAGQTFVVRLSWTSSPPQFVYTKVVGKMMMIVINHDNGTGIKTTTHACICWKTCQIFYFTKKWGNCGHEGVMQVK